MKKKKQIIMISIIIILLITIVIGFYVYNCTDYLKTNQQLFWKYVVKNSDITEVFSNDNIEQFKNKKNSNSYITKTDFFVNVNNQKYNLNANSNANGGNNNIETKVSITKDSDNIIDFNLVKKNNIVGVKIDELANGYITLKNSNLKQVFENMGITELDYIPDNINWGTAIDLLEISEEDKNYLTDKYSKFIVLDTQSQNYSKEEAVGIKIDNVIHSATSYKLTLTENETKKILVDTIKEISKDSRALNLISSKMKLLNLPQEKCQISTISNKLNELADKVDNVYTTSDEFIEISVYVEKGNLLQTNLKIYEDKLIKITCDKENNGINIKQELLKNDIDSKFIVSISDALNKAVKMVQEVNITNKISDDKNSIETNIIVECKNNINLGYISTTKITDDVEQNVDYDNSAKIILNDLNERQFKNLYNAVKELLPKIYNEKKQLLLGDNQTNEESQQ